MPAHGCWHTTLLLVAFLGLLQIRRVSGSFLDTITEDFYSADFSWCDPPGELKDPYGSDDDYRMDYQEEMNRLMYVMEYRAFHNGAYPPAPPRTPRTPREPPFSPRTPRERDPPSIPSMPSAPCSPRTPRGTPSTPRKPQSPLAQEIVLPGREEFVRPYHHDRHRHGNQRAGGRKMTKRKGRRRVAKVPSEDLGFYS